MSETRTCDWCGKAFSRRKGSSLRIWTAFRFCSRYCARHWYGRDRTKAELPAREIKKPAEPKRLEQPEGKICLVCGRPFYRNGLRPADWARAKYCGPACRRTKQSQPNGSSPKDGACQYYPRIKINSAECKARLKLSCHNCRHMGLNMAPLMIDPWERPGEQC